MTSSGVDRTETLRHTATALLGSVNCRDENDITLVTLYIFKILHEKGFECTFPVLTIALGMIVMGKEPIHFLGQYLALCLIDGDNAEGALRIAGHECLCCFGDRSGL